MSYDGRSEVSVADGRGAEPQTKGSAAYWELSDEFALVDMGVGLSKWIKSSQVRSSAQGLFPDVEMKHWIQTPHRPQ